VDTGGPTRHHRPTGAGRSGHAGRIAGCRIARGVLRQGFGSGLPASRSILSALVSWL